MITHYCSDGSTHELDKGRYLAEAGEYRTECDNCGPVYNNGTVEHE